jgi:signal transduction histidine kinase
MIKTLRRKFIGIAMGSMALVLILLIGGMNMMNYRSMISDTDMRLNILADNSGRFPVNMPSEPTPTNPDKAISESPLQTPSISGEYDVPDTSDNADHNNLFNSHNFKRLSAEAPYDTRFFTVVIKNDDTIVSVDTGKIAAVSTSEAAEFARTLQGQKKEFGFLDNYRYRIISVDGTNNERNTMYIFLDCERELNSFKNSLISSISTSVLGMLLVFILVVYFSKLLVRPVAESYDKQKQFITDASHELKTPLTIIDANTEVLEMETGENEWTKSIHNQISRLNSLTKQLVFLSRMDEGNSASFTMLDFSLSDAVEETAESFKAVATTAGKNLTCSVTAGLSINGDEASIRQLVSLLLDNAIKYSSEHGSIELTLKANGRNKILTVWNTADNVSAGKLDILFDRFYRADSSRSSKAGGFGIGLSVAKAIVTAHKGKITAKSEDGKSILFTVIM